MPCNTCEKSFWDVSRPACPTSRRLEVINPGMLKTFECQGYEPRREDLVAPQYATGDEFGNFYQTRAPSLDAAREKFRRHMERDRE